MNNGPNWTLEEYKLICERDKTDGTIFWSKVTVLIAVNFGLLGILSFKNGDTQNFQLIKAINFAGLIFSFFWWFVLWRQAEWVKFWKDELRALEDNSGFGIKIQTRGDKYGLNMGCYLKLGSYLVVTHVLPLGFAALWMVVPFLLPTGLIHRCVVTALGSGLIILAGIFLCFRNIETHKEKSCFGRLQLYVFNFLTRIVRMEKGAMKSQNPDSEKKSNWISSLIVALLIGVSVFFLSPLPERIHIPYPWILGSIAFVIAFVALTRPWNIQTAVVIGFITLMFNGLGTLWQKENFELRNRPYIQILDREFKLGLTSIFRMSGPTPEPAFEFVWPLINHGPTPATINDILIKGHSDKAKLIGPEAISIGPYWEDRLSQWRTQDVFMPVNGQTNALSRRLFFYLNVGDVKKLLGVDLDEKEISKSAAPLSNINGFLVSPYLEAKGKEPFPRFYLLVQLEYHALGEAEKGKQPYWYWVIYEYREGIFRPIESGTKKKINRST